MTLIFNNGSINGSGGGSEDTYTKAEINGLLSAKSNTSLDNLNADGQMVIDSQNGTISNCILEIPQNIKLTLENNVATAKSGSTVVLSGSTYTTATLTQDETFTISNTTADGTYALYYFYTGQFSWHPLTINKIELFCSGSTDSLAGTGQHIWFDTTNKIIKRYSADESSYVDSTYPLAIINVNNGNASFAKDSKGRDLIFNGAGFIGHHAFVYPNIKALLSSEFNEDGTLKSVIRTNNALRIVELTQNYNTVFMNNYSSYISTQISGDDVNSYSDITQEVVFHYVKDSNIWGRVVSGANQYAELAKIADFSYNGTTVTDFTIRQPVRLATTEMLDKVQDQVDTNTSDIAGKAGLADNNTFTGGNTFRGQINQQASASESGSTYYTYINQKVTNIDYTTNPSYNGYYYGIMFRDKNDKALAYITYGYGTAGNSNCTITVKTRNENNSADVESSIVFNIARNGVASFTIPTPTQDNTTSTQADTVGARNTKLATLFTSITGYDSTKAQTLKHDNTGALTWVDD